MLWYQFPTCAVLVSSSWYLREFKNIMAERTQYNLACPVWKKLRMELMSKIKGQAEAKHILPYILQFADCSPIKRHTQEFLFRSIEPSTPCDFISSDFAADVAAWFIVGLILIAIGKIMFLYSEVKAVLVCRDQEFRKFLHDNDYMLPSAAGIAELEMKESESMRPRVIISLIGFGLVSLGLSAVLLPTCDIFEIIGIPKMPCWLLVSLGAFAGAMVFSFFTLSVVWSCTRPWAALVFLVLWGSGAFVITYATPFLLTLWSVLAMLLFYWYFRVLPEQYDHDQRPSWFQDVGDLSLVWDDYDWRMAVNMAIHGQGQASNKQK
mmetsp:Transcript_11468/g.31984  ORF Transcript_11468/g.31984 Transcript_11468/m.31984 type:complete len:322 (+) Transcript_11468:94-1059(+)